MTNRELLREIYKESKAINRNIQRVANVGLLGIFERVAKEAEKNVGILYNKNKVDANDVKSWQWISFW